MKNEFKEASVANILSTLIEKMSKAIVEKELPFLVNAFNYVVATNPWRALELLTQNTIIPEGWCLAFYLDLIKNNIAHSTAVACTVRLHEALFGKGDNIAKESVDRLLSNYLKMSCPAPAQLIKTNSESRQSIMDDPLS